MCDSHTRTAAAVDEPARDDTRTTVQHYIYLHCVHADSVHLLANCALTLASHVHCLIFMHVRCVSFL